MFTPRHFQLPPSGCSAARQGTVICTPDRPSTRAHLAPLHLHSQPHLIHALTRQCSDRDVLASTSFQAPHRSTFSEVSSPYAQTLQQAERGAGPSNFPNNEEVGSRMASSPHMVPNPTEPTPQPNPLKKKAAETQSSKRQYKCDVCGSCWGRPSALRTHMVSHTGAKGADPHYFPVYSQTEVNRSEFVCSICKRGFGVKSSCTRHARVHRKDSSEKIQAKVAGRLRRGSHLNRDVKPARSVDRGPKPQG